MTEGAPERDHSARSRDAGARLSDRADELVRRLDELMHGVRDAAEALRADLDDLRRNAAHPAEPGASRLRRKPPASAPPGVGVAQPDDELIAEVEELAAKTPDVKAPVADLAGAAPEGARVLALKMARDGTPREDTARYLSENFALDDPDGLLDEVYAKAGRQ